MPLEHHGKSPEQILEDMKSVVRNIPTKVANLAENHFKGNFDSESWDGEAWKPRNPNAPRNQGRKLLRDSNTLYNALEGTAVGPNVTVRVNPPADKYGEIHNTGGIITTSITRQSKKFAWAMFYKTQNAMWKAIAMKGKIGEKRTITIPQRKYIGESAALNEKIRLKIDFEILKAYGL